MTESHITDRAAGSAMLVRLRPKLKWIGASLASIAAVGAVVGGLTGYWSAWKAVQTEFAPRAPPPVQKPPLIVSKGPSIAVLPLTKSSGGAALDELADTMTQQLTSSLGRFSTLRLTPRAAAAELAKHGDIEAARKAGVDYLVTGDIRPFGDGARAGVHVADLRTDQEIWSQTLEASADRLRDATAGYELGDIAAAQIGGYPGAISTAEYTKIQSKPVGELTAYECILQGIFAVAFQSTTAVVLRARECADQLVQREPTNALAIAVRSGILAVQRNWGWGLPSEQAASVEKRLYLNEEIRRDAARAIDLAPDDTAVRTRYAVAVWTSCQLDLFRQEVENAISLNPNDPWALGVLGTDLAVTGDWDKGAEMAERAIRLGGPKASIVWWWGPAKRHWFRGEYQQAFDDFRHTYVESFWATYVDRAYTLPFLDRLDEAKAAITKLLQLKPNMTIREIDAYYRMWCFQPEYIEKMNGALRQAGLPE